MSNFRYFPSWVIRFAWIVGYRKTSASRGFIRIPLDSLSPWSPWTQRIQWGSGVLTATFLLLLMSCNLQNKITLQGSGQGIMELSLSIPPYMLETMDTLAQSLPGGAALLEPERISSELQKNQDISDVSVQSQTRGSYHIRFRFSNFQRSSSVGGQDLLSWNEQPDGSTQLAMRFNRSTYAALEQRFTALRDNAFLQLYGPATTQGMSRSDYLDMIEYSFGAQAREDLPAALANIRVQVPNQVISQIGGAVRSRNEVEFTIPLLDLILLQTPRDYSITYR